MNARTARLAKLLSRAESRLPIYLEQTRGLSRETKGIRRSEMFFLYASVAALNPARIIESGRARAQSTLVLARLFPGASIVSFESDQASPDVKVAAERLRDCGNIDCRFGDSLLLLPKLVEAGDIVLIDGPKDFRALKLAFRLLRSGKPAAVFVHDLWLGSPARRFVDRYLPSAVLSDEPQWVQRYASLDSSHRAPPLAFSDLRQVYGATMGCFEAGQENYSLRLVQSSAAQGADRIRETTRKILRRPSTVRSKDFTTFPISTPRR
jgi:predicted O-methyltransferase YrrM